MIADENGDVWLLGLDFGSTTSSALLARAKIRASSATGRMEFSAPQVVFRPAPVFTPFVGEDIDIAAVGDLLDGWMTGMGVVSGGVFAGGAIVTGLAARAGNATALRALVRERVGDAVMATADDPRLESWLAFMGSVATLSRAHGGTVFINLDIGGGTTNAATGRDGEVLDTACHFIGARHLRFVPGSYRITAISPFGQAMLDALGLDSAVGDELGATERQRLLDYCIEALIEIVDGTGKAFGRDETRCIEQAPWLHSPTGSEVVTFSGGVGELVYRLAAGETPPGTTHYGDLGVDLAEAILRSPRLAANLRRFVPENRGRATCYGVALHSTEISGTTLFLPDATMLPLHDVPVLGRIGIDEDVAQLAATLALARHCHTAAAVLLDVGDTGQSIGVDRLRNLGRRLAEAFIDAGVGSDSPLVVLVNQNVGKALGHYATDWGRLPTRLIVIDEVPGRRAHFVNLGRLHRQVVPVSFYGLR
jgi:ethanolamine utilization protein EutA